jgi:hypothetical protein
VAHAYRLIQVSGLWWSADTDANANSDAHSNTDANTDANTHANTDADTNAPAKRTRQSDGDGCFDKSDKPVVVG